MTADKYVTQFWYRPAAASATAVSSSPRGAAWWSPSKLVVLRLIGQCIPLSYAFRSYWHMEDKVYNDTMPVSHGHGSCREDQR